ncbi:hypothetical protein CoNPh23_CDS0022 [Staphylococcus phage S-CoN_Ph23]|nr:hypothetical protein CoNPh18_CDS0084 [Staphylococcus phage S-CoN_Ph18]WNM54576.1 hypothetical protein CoNPh19_CDS0029 [Staphylococcus phage S-CoN_Ph19]WNM54701.1 hypothetical protein CoNPh20_CDS0075 [Staphylococcus phage S-CoN_Ph20]WNM54745.1 hypothetical protein CoNPh21_CDS0036 [Staphylococcus phage S-CoN_Ph21]WNM54816.1 hypothetical protein CoNPh22_CDS0032 [Staphylococcus phage S-CoN_Ph22]WNM54885.1 hypothetical protein CoNPh23_CDS0022 [Staphylococcus phage S-CoN_Ph23]
MYAPILTTHRIRTHILKDTTYLRWGLKVILFKVKYF